MDYLTALLPYGGVLLGFLITIFIVNRLTRDVRPIFVNIVGGVAKNAGSNATAYAIAIMFGLSASLSAFVDVFKEMSAAQLHAISFHQYLAMWAKVLNPFIVAVLAYATQNKFVPKPVVTSSSTPPFPPTNPTT